MENFEILVTEVDVQEEGGSIRQMAALPQNTERGSRQVNVGRVSHGKSTHYLQTAPALPGRALHLWAGNIIVQFVVV